MTAPLHASGSSAPAVPAVAPADSPWLGEEQQRVWRQWLACTGSLPTVLNQQLQADSQLSLQDFTVLVRLSEIAEYRMRMAALAASVDWDRSRLSHHVSRMEKRDLVVREACPQDRRGAYVVLTEHGRVSIEQAAPGHARLVRALMFDPLDADELAAMDTLTLALQKRLEARRA